MRLRLSWAAAGYALAVFCCDATTTHYADANGANHASVIRITWQSVNGVNYFVQRSDDLSVPPPFSTIQSNIMGLPGMTSYTDTSAVGSGAFFYRVDVQ